MSAWIPANALLQIPYSKLNYSHALNIVPNSGTRNQNFKNAVDSNRNHGTRMGGQTTYGAVTKIGGKFVKKTMKFPINNQSTDYLKIFLNEIRVGAIPGIKEVGPKIYAWRVNRNSQGQATSGEYIMDDFTVAPPNYTTVPFLEYTRKVLKNVCPVPQSNFYQKLKESLTKFWKITKGYHGDLHAGNMAIMYENSSLDVEKFIIFDYGSHKKFKTATNENTCFDRFIYIIDTEFKNRYSKNTVMRGYYPENTKIKMVAPRRGQIIRSNTQMLRTYNLGGYKNRLNKSLMASMHPDNYMRRLAKSVKVYKKGKTGNNIFVQRSNMMNAVKQSGIPVRPRNRLVYMSMKSYPEKTQSQIIAALRNHFKNYSSRKYDENNRKGELFLPTVRKSEFMRMLNNLKKETPPASTVNAEKLFKTLKSIVKKKEPSASTPNVIKVLKKMRPSNFQQIKISNENYNKMLAYLK